jgi:hypothetical protein
MKNKILKLFIMKNYMFIIGCILCFSSCTKENENALPSALSIKVVSPKADAGSSDTKDVNTRSSNTETDRAENDTVLWCNGSDIEWYNATTGELKLNNPYSNEFHDPIDGSLVIFLYDKELLNFPIDCWDLLSYYVIFPHIKVVSIKVELPPSSEPKEDRVIDQALHDQLLREGLYLRKYRDYRYYISKGFEISHEDEYYKYRYRYFDVTVHKKTWKELEPEWNLFIEQLKKEGKYRE